MRIISFFLSSIFLACHLFSLQSENINISQEVITIDVYDFIEITISNNNPKEINPFQDVDIQGWFWQKNNENKRTKVIGFCDSYDGKIFKIRFMPNIVGKYLYKISYKEKNGIEKIFTGSFEAIHSLNKGVVIVDSINKNHFIWSYTGEHYFYNGTTAYHLLSWTDENKILSEIDRMEKLGCNRIRLLNYGRASNNEWGEGMTQSDKFVWTLCPWPAQYPTRMLKEGSPVFDHTKFNLAHWQKFEKALMQMKKQNIVASIIMYMDRGIKDAPEAFSDLEKQYFKYAIARYGAFSNIMWDIGNEHDEYRSKEWAKYISNFIRENDQYPHLITAHGRKEFIYDDESWPDFAIHQRWNDGQNEFMLSKRNTMKRIIPQVNEEYGYENHKGSGQVEVRKRAWEITLAGCYQTTGEWKGWQHGEAHDSSKILLWTGLMKKFMERFDWWLMHPSNHIITDGKGFALADSCKAYIIYIPKESTVKVKIQNGTYECGWFNPNNGNENKFTVKVNGGEFLSDMPPSIGDWVLYLKSNK